MRRRGSAPVIAGLVAGLLSPRAYAFHSGGVAECEGCHSMHSPRAGGSFLLVGTDPSSTCLTCHEAADAAPSGYHVSSAGQPIPTERTPGGDFAWLKKTYAYASGGEPFTEPGSTHGHNVVAVDNGYDADAVNTTAPGGSFPADQLACISCHDPHGRYRRLATGAVATTGAPIRASGSYPGASGEPTATEAVGVYRLLAGNGYAKGGVTFQGVPAAKVPSTYNRSEAVTQIRTAYGHAVTGGHVAWGAWCATCHPAMHSSGGNVVHPVDRTLPPGMAREYGMYVRSGTLRRGADAPSAPSFLSLVPFVEGTGDYAVLASHAVDDGSQLGGPTSADRVSCLSCHRAHASGFANALRFDVGYEFMVKAGAYVGWDNPAVGATGRGPLQSRGRTVADWQAAYYDRPANLWATYQRVLCNKCHVKD